jgi:hypothetical protein
MIHEISNIVDHYMGLLPDVWYSVDHHPWHEGCGFLIAETDKGGRNGVVFRFIISKTMGNSVGSYILQVESVVGLKDATYIAPLAEAELCQKYKQAKWIEEARLIKVDLLALYNQRKEEALSGI